MQSKVGKKLWEFRYCLAVLLLGLVLLLWPQSAGSATQAVFSGADPLEATGVSLETEGQKLAGLLAEIQGVGRAEVLLSSNGAVIVCDGASGAAVRLAVTEAVMSYTGFGSDHIAVMQMK